MSPLNELQHRFGERSANLAPALKHPNWQGASSCMAFKVLSSFPLRSNSLGYKSSSAGEGWDRLGLPCICPFRPTFHLLPCPERAESGTRQERVPWPAKSQGQENMPWASLDNFNRPGG